MMTEENSESKQIVDKIVSESDAWDMIFRDETFIYECADEIFSNDLNEKGSTHEEIIKRVKSAYQENRFDDYPDYNLRSDGQVEVSYDENIVTGEHFSKVEIVTEQEAWDDLFEECVFTDELFREIKERLTQGLPTEDAQVIVETRWKSRGINSYPKRFLRSDGKVELDRTK